MTNVTYEAALVRMMTSGVPHAVAKSVSTDAQQALGPLRSVLGFAASVPASPSAGDSYVITSGAQANNIALYATDGTWHYSVPSPGDIIFNQDDGFWYAFDASLFWLVFGPTVQTPESFGAYGFSDPDDVDPPDDAIALQRFLNYTGAKYANPSRYYYSSVALTCRSQTPAIGGVFHLQTGVATLTTGLTFRPVEDWTDVLVTTTAVSGATAIIVADGTDFVVGQLCHIRSNQWFDLATRSTLGECRVIKSVTSGTIGLESPLEFTYDLTALAQLTLVNRGAGYVLNDILPVVGGTGSAAAIRVCQVSGTGAITDWVPDTWGSYSAFPTGTVPLSGGSGSNATCTVVATSVHAGCINPIHPDLNLDVVSRNPTRRVSGVEIIMPLGGQTRIAGGQNGDRTIRISGGIDHEVFPDVIHDDNGQTTSYGISISGAARGHKIWGGLFWFNRHCMTTNNPNDDLVSGIPMDIYADGMLVECSAPFPTTPVLVSSVDTGADTMTIAFGTTNTRQTVSFTTTLTLPAPLVVLTLYYLTLVSPDTWILYPTAADQNAGTNQINITTTGTGTIMAVPSSGGDAIDTHTAAKRIHFNDCLVYSSTNQGINLECSGGSIRNSLFMHTSNTAIGIRTKGFYDCAWLVENVEVISAGDSGASSGHHGLYVSSGFGTNDTVTIRGIKTRSVADIAVYLIGRPAGSLTVKELSGIDVDAGAAGSASGTVYLSNVNVQCALQGSIIGVPTSGLGLRLLDAKGVRDFAGLIQAGADSVTCVYAEGSTAGGCAYNSFLSTECDGNGFSSSIGVKFNSSNVQNCTIGLGVTFKSIATPWTVSTGTGHSIFPALYASFDQGNSGTATKTFNRYVAASQSVTSTGNWTIAFSNLPATGVAWSMRMKIVNGGAHTVTYPGAVSFTAGGAPALSAAGTNFVDFFGTESTTTIWATLVP